MISSIERFRGTPSPSGQSGTAMLNSVFGFNLPCHRNYRNSCIGSYERRIRGLQQMVFSSSPSKKLTQNRKASSTLSGSGPAGTLSSGSALNLAGVADRLTYVSTAGGAFLEWLKKEDLA